jgi:SAD/SRA domain
MLPSQSNPRIGSIPGIAVGATFETRYILFNPTRFHINRSGKRDECRIANLHSRSVAGISGTVKDGAYSIVMSGAYEDDEDHGESL